MILVAEALVSNEETVGTRGALYVHIKMWKRLKESSVADRAQDGLDGMKDAAWWT